jgi:hypothetical protein
MGWRPRLQDAFEATDIVVPAQTISPRPPLAHEHPNSELAAAALFPGRAWHGCSAGLLAMGKPRLLQGKQALPVCLIIPADSSAAPAIAVSLTLALAHRHLSVDDVRSRLDY